MKYKENSENHHVPKQQIEFVVYPIQRKPLTAFSPNTLTQIQTEKTCSAAVCATRMQLKTAGEKMTAIA